MAEIKAPKHLHRATKKWYREVVAEWGLEEHHIRILIGACEAWDRGVQAREVIDREGLTYEDRFGAPRARPEIAVERDARIAFLRAIRELDLDVDAPLEAKRPRALLSNKG